MGFPKFTFSFSFIRDLWGSVGREGGYLAEYFLLEYVWQNSTTFYDDIEIEVSVKEFKGVKLVISYIMKNVKDDKVVLIGTSKHCFTDFNGRPIILKKKNEKLDEKLKSLANEK